MVSLQTFLLFCAISLACFVEASHIKRHRFPHHRTQCLPRLSSASNEAATEVDIRSTARQVSSVVSVKTSVLHPPPPPSSSSYSFTFVPSTVSEDIHQPSSTLLVVPTSEAAEGTNYAPKQALATQDPTPDRASLIPNSIKAGIAGGDAYPFMKDHIGWWYDWSPNPSKPGKPIAIPMLWGNGTVDNQDAQRLKAFEHLATVPKYVLGFEEPDCVSGSGSAGMSVEDGVSKWEALIAPLKAKGSKLGSPSMCKQADETWLKAFQAEIRTMWDFTTIHINKNSLDGVKEDIAHYLTYGKPIWVTEFACVNDFEQFTPCTDQEEINQFINDAVPYFEENPNIYAYAYSNGLGLGDVWPLMNGNSLSESGQTYLAVISQFH